MIIFFGTKVRKKTLGSGQFYCPRCQTTRPYLRQQGTRYFTIYFIPILPMGDIGEFVECGVCGGMFEPSVLDMKLKNKPTTLAEMLNTLAARLEHGIPVEYMIRDLTAAGLELETARKAIDSAIGTARHYFPACSLTYAASVQTCRECQKPLEPYRP